MHVLVTKPEYIIKCLSLYKNITCRLNRTVTGEKIAAFRFPKLGHEEYQPCIVIFNADSDKIYQLCQSHDHENTQCIMEIIRKKFVIPKENESLFFIIFVLLHEAGHWYDYHNRREWFIKNFSDEPCGVEEYRQRPWEKSADIFAMDHFEEAWNELTPCFHGFMEPLKKTAD